MVITNQNDAPMLISWQFELNQDAAFPGTLIGTLLAKDEDLGDVVTFSIQTPGPYDSLIELDEVSGAVSVISTGESSVCFPTELSSVLRCGNQLGMFDRSGPSGSVVVFPTGTLVVPIFLNDSSGEVVSGNISIKVIPSGAALFLGFTTLPATGLSTAGGDYLVGQASNLIGSLPVMATYSRSDLSLSFTTTVRSIVCAIMDVWPSLESVGVDSQNCSVLSVSSFACYSVPGVGSNLVWSLYYGGALVPVGQTVGPTVTSYLPPTISSVTALSSLPLSQLRTTGADFVLISGKGACPVIGLVSGVPLKGMCCFIE